MGEPAIKKAITVLDMLSKNPETVRLAELRMKKTITATIHFVSFFLYIKMLQCNIVEEF